MTIYHIDEKELDKMHCALFYFLLVVLFLFPWSFLGGSKGKVQGNIIKELGKYQEYSCCILCLDGLCMRPAHALNGPMT